MTRTNWILLIILILQILVILLWDNPWSASPYGEESGDSKAVALFPEFSVEAASSVRIEGREKRIELKKGTGAEGAWYLEASGKRYKADRLRVESLLSSITRLKKTDVVSRAPEKALIFEVDDASALHLTVSDPSGEERVRLLVGKSLGALRGTYVKVPDQDEVYLQMENIRRACVKSDDWILSWRDKTLFACDGSDIREIEIVGSRGKIRVKYEPVEGEEGGWIMISPREGKIKITEGRRMAESLSELKAREFVVGPDLEELGLSEPSLEIVVTLERDRGVDRVKFSTSDEKEGARYVMMNDDPDTCCRVAGYFFYPFLLRPEELLDSGD